MAKIIKIKDLLEGGKGSGPQKGGKSLGSFFANKLKKNIDKYNKKAYKDLKDK